MKSLSPPVLSPPELRPARFEDYPQIQELEAAYLPGSLREADWRSLWLDNPLWPRLGDRWPIGWVLEDASGRLVGSLGSVPSLYRFRGRELVCGNGRAWVVRPEYRGLAPWLMDEHFNQSNVDLFLTTTVGPHAAPLIDTWAARIPLGDWENRAYWVTRYRGFACEVLKLKRIPLPGVLALPAAAALRLRDACFTQRLPAAPAGFDISAADGFDTRFDLFWEELCRQSPEKLLAVRDSRTLSWHYAIPKRAGRLWIFTASRGGLLRAYCVLNRQDPGAGLRRMRLVDYQTLEPDTDLLPGLLRAALRRCAAEGFDVLEHLGCGLPKMGCLDQCAPYRRRLPNWAYYYRAVDPDLEAQLRRPESWDPSSFDGDASIA